MNASAHNWQVGQKIGRYELLEYLGGGMAAVYRAFDPIMGRTVAVKLLLGKDCQNPETRLRFLREARLAASIEHENILRIYDCGECDGVPFLVMEFLRGEDLSSAIRKQHTGSIAQRILILRQLAAALTAVHRMGIVHRDVKPANVHLDESGRVRLMDFGIARSNGFELTQTGISVGTPSYMAPEQVQASGVDGRADLYSFGVLAFELISGRCPVQGETLETVFYRILHEALPLEELRTDGVPDGLIQLIAKCTEKQAKNRPENGEEICRQLDAIIQGDKKLSFLSPPEVHQRISRNWRLWAMASAGGLLLALAATLVIFHPHRQKQVQVEAFLVKPDHGQARNESMDYFPAGPVAIRERGKRPHVVSLPAFYIDHHPVTWGQLRRFCVASRLSCPPETESSNDREPAAFISFDLAQAYAHFEGKRLPSMKELERFHPHDASGQSLAPDREPQDREPPRREPIRRSPFEDGDLPGDGPFRNIAFLRRSGPDHESVERWEWSADSAHPTALAARAYAAFLQPPPTTEESWVYLHGEGRIRSPFTQGVADGWTICPTRYRAADLGFRCARDAK